MTKKVNPLKTPPFCIDQDCRHGMICLPPGCFYIAGATQICLKRKPCEMSFIRNNHFRAYFANSFTIIIQIRCKFYFALTQNLKKLSPQISQMLLWYVQSFVAIWWTAPSHYLNHAGILLIGRLGTNLIELLIKIHTFSFKKMHLNLSSAKWRPCCLGLNLFIIPSCQILPYLAHITVLSQSALSETSKRLGSHEIINGQTKFHKSLMWCEFRWNILYCNSQ